MSGAERCASIQHCGLRSLYDRPRLLWIHQPSCFKLEKHAEYRRERGLINGGVTSRAREAHEIKTQTPKPKNPNGKPQNPNHKQKKMEKRERVTREKRQRRKRGIAQAPLSFIFIFILFFKYSRLWGQVMSRPPLSLSRFF